MSLNTYIRVHVYTVCNQRKYNRVIGIMIVNIPIYHVSNRHVQFWFKPYCSRKLEFERVFNHCAHQKLGRELLRAINLIHNIIILLLLNFLVVCTNFYIPNEYPQISWQCHDQTCFTKCVNLRFINTCISLIGMF